MFRINRISIRSLSDAIKNRIQKQVDSSEVVVFMKGTKSMPQCGFSKAVMQILQAQGVTEFNHFNVLEDEELRTGIKEFSQWPTIPQVYIKGEFTGGCDIMMNMHQSGELEDLLIQKGILESEDTESKNK